MAIQCPKCKKGTIKKTKTETQSIGVHCSEKYMVKNDNGEWQNKGCDFQIFFDQKKFYGIVLKDEDVKAILSNQSVKSKHSETGKEIEIILNLKSKSFLGIKKAEDEDF